MHEIAELRVRRAMGFKIPSVVSIAGSDSSGGAGIQADLKTIEALGLFAQTAITALTAQNTLGVSGVLDVPSDFVVEQIDAVFGDIRPSAVKIGMVSSASNVVAIAESLRAHAAENIVVDPVMVSTSGSRLISDDASGALVERLFPIASMITPNIPEAEVLWGRSIAMKRWPSAGLRAGCLASASRTTIRMARVARFRARLRAGSRRASPCLRRASMRSAIFRERLLPSLI